MITTNFARYEFCCRCGCGLAEPHPTLVTLLQALRTCLRQKVTISSGSRCREHNTREGGAPNSYHMPRTDYDGYTLAADIMVPQVRLDVVYDMAEHLGFRGIAPYLQDEQWFLHLDVRGCNGIEVDEYRAGWIDRHPATVGAVLKEEARRRFGRHSNVV